MNKQQFPHFCRFTCSTLIPAVLLAWVLISAWSVAVAAEESTGPTRKQLRKAAYDSQWRLQRAMERDGFYSARVALNVWRSNALDAGIFDQAKFDDFKKQIYEKSVQSNLNCFETSLEKGNFTDARICLYTWKNHAQELGTFEQKHYDDLIAQLEEQRKIQTQEEQKQTQTPAD